MKKQVIVGAGVIGLYLAHLLKDMGLDPIVIDPRTGPYDAKMAADKSIKTRDPHTGEYTRPGYIQPDLFDLISTQLGFKFDPKKKKHIKDIERALYDLAIARQIDVRKARFVEFTDEGMVIQDEVSGKKEPIQCDEAFDATGGARVLVEAINKAAAKGEIESKQPFSIDRIANNPHKKHFGAYVKLTDAAEQKKINSFIERREKYIELQNTKENQEFLAELKTHFGWTGETIPTFRVIPFGKNKFSFHFEIPKDLPPEQYDIFLKALVSHYTDVHDLHYSQIDTRKYHKKPRFMAYDVDPHAVTPAHFQKQKKFPTVRVIGDALCQSDYRDANGIKLGIHLVNILLSHAKVKDGILLVDESKCQTAISQEIEKHKIRLERGYSKRRIKANQVTPSPTFFPKPVEKKAEHKQPTPAAKKPLTKYKKVEFNVNDIQFKITSNLSVDIAHGKDSCWLLLNDLEAKGQKIESMPQQELLEYILKLLKTDKGFGSSRPEHIKMAIEKITLALTPPSQSCAIL